MGLQKRAEQAGSYRTRTTNYRRNLHLLPQTCLNLHQVTAQASKKSERTGSNEGEMGLNTANKQRFCFAGENHICSYTHLSTWSQKSPAGQRLPGLAPGFMGCLGLGAAHFMYHLPLPASPSATQRHSFPLPALQNVC